MSARRRRPTLEERLDELSALRDDPDSAATCEKLKKGLADRQNILVARAARIVGDLGKEELTADLAQAFDRFMESPGETDKGCLATTAIVKALVELEYPSAGLFLRGIRHVQMEGAYGGPVDAAIEVRSNSALGLVNAGHPDAVLKLVPLLLDEGLPVRLAAAQAIAASGHLGAETVLRLKALMGDDEPEVTTECLAGLLRLSPRRSLEFLRTLLAAPAARSGSASERRAALLGGGGRGRQGAGASLREAAILALGESRLEEAVPLLCEAWRRTYDRESRRSVLLALVSSRREPALDFLLSLVAEEEPPAAKEVLTALSIHRHDERIRRRVEEALAKSDDADELEGHFEREFS